MSSILWGILIILFIPLFGMVFARVYNMIVADFSPDKKKRKEATKEDANYEEYHEVDDPQIQPKYKHSFAGEAAETS